MNCGMFFTSSPSISGFVASQKQYKYSLHKALELLSEYLFLTAMLFIKKLI